MSENELIQRSKAGDLKAFEKIYRNYSPRVFRYSLRMLNHREDAEDVVQTVFLSLYRGLHRFRRESALGTYLMTIARNACYDKLNRRRKNGAEEFKEEEAMIENTPLYERQDIESAIAALPVRMRECFVLFAVEGYPQEEIARILDVQIGTVKAMTFQARKKIRAMLEEERENEKPM